MKWKWYDVLCAVSVNWLTAAQLDQSHWYGFWLGLLPLQLLLSTTPFNTIPPTGSAPFAVFFRLPFWQQPICVEFACPPHVSTNVSLNGCLSLWSVLTRELRRKPAALGPDLLRSLSFTHEQGSRRFSIRTCSERHRNLCSAEVREVKQAGAVHDALIPLQRSQVCVYSTWTPASALITESSLDIFFLVSSTCMKPLFHAEIIVSILSWPCDTRVTIQVVPHLSPDHRWDWLQLPMEAVSGWMFVCSLFSHVSKRALFY